MNKETNPPDLYDYGYTVHFYNFNFVLLWNEVNVYCIVLYQMDSLNKSFVYRVAAYVDSMKAWYDIKTKQEILNKTVFAKVQVRFEDNFQVVVRRTIVLLSSRNRLMQPNVQMFSKYASTTV